MAEGRRIRMRLAYDGTAYAGLQRQLNVPSVQAELEDALGALTGTGRVVVHAASRTDAGVHAMGQEVHFDTLSRIPAEKLPYALNTMLPADIRVLEARQVSPDFHARFDATGKLYRYSIYNARHYSPLHRLTHAHIPVPLDTPLMLREAEALLGTQDFAPFAAAGSVVKKTVRTMHSVWMTKKGPEIEIYVHGNAFLYNMVRIFAGTLIDVGRGKLDPGAIARAITSGSRLDLGITAPARGLTLLKVFYGDDEQVEETLRDYMDARELI